MKLLVLSLLLCALCVRGLSADMDEFPICDATARGKCNAIIKKCYSCFADRSPWLISRSARPQFNCPAECCFKAYESPAIPMQFHVVLCLSGCCSRMVVSYKSLKARTWNFKVLTYVWNDSAYGSKDADDVCSVTTGNNRSCAPELACAFLPGNPGQCTGRDTINVNKPGKWSDKLPCPPTPPPPAPPAAAPAAPAAPKPVAAPVVPATPKPVVAPVAPVAPKPVAAPAPAPVTPPSAPKGGKAPPPVKPVPVPVSAPAPPADKPAAPAAPAEKPDADGDAPAKKPVAGENIPLSKPIQGGGDGNKKQPREPEGDAPENGATEENGETKPEGGDLEGVEADSAGGSANAKNSTKRDCFPSHATVYVEGGVRIRMDELKVGDKVLVSTTENVYSTVHTFTHSDARVSSEFIRLSFKGTTLEVSPGHYVYVEKRGLIAARNINAGDMMSNRRVLKVEKTYATGLFNPHTLKGDIVVDGILASCYTEAVEVAEAHALLAPLRMLGYGAGIFVPSVV